MQKGGKRMTRRKNWIAVGAIWLVVLVFTLLLREIGGLVTGDLPNEQPGTERPLWSSVEPGELGRRLGRLVNDAEAFSTRVRGHFGTEGTDLRVGLDVDARGVVELYPDGFFCAHCAKQGCYFEENASQALEGLPASVPWDALVALASDLGEGRLRIEFAASADQQPIRQTTQQRVCVGTERVGEPRSNTYAEYAEECGPASCTALNGSAIEMFRSSLIDSNAKLACLRAACIWHRVSDRMGPLRVALRGEVVDADDSRLRRVSVVISLVGLMAQEHGSYAKRVTAEYQRERDRSD